MTTDLRCPTCASANVVTSRPERTVQSPLQALTSARPSGKELCGWIDPRGFPMAWVPQEDPRVPHRVYVPRVSDSSKSPGAVASTTTWRVEIVSGRGMGNSRSDLHAVRIR